MDTSKMSVKELKAYVKLYKKVHKTPYGKLKRGDLVALAEKVCKGEMEKKAPEAGAAPKAARVATEKQKEHRALFGAWVKAKSGMSFADFKAGHHAPAAAAAPKVSKKEIKKRMEALSKGVEEVVHHVRAKVVKSKLDALHKGVSEVVEHVKAKAARKPKAKKDLGATPSPAPKMKVEVIQKAAEKELVDAMGGKAKAKSFIVGKELVGALGGKAKNS